MQQHIPVIAAKADPKPEHGQMPVSDPVQANRNLRHGKHDMDHLHRRIFRRILGIEHDHVGMDRGLARKKTQIQRTDPVLNEIVRAIIRSEHISVCSHKRPDIRLTEFDQNIGLERFEPAHDVGQQAVDGLGNRRVIPTVSVSEHNWRARSEAETVHEIELEPVNVPVGYRLLVYPDQILPHFRNTGVQNPGIQIVVDTEELVRKFVPYFAVFPTNGTEYHSMYFIPRS